MRIILYTGKGGVGKTSIAAATAVKSAAGGKKTLVVSTDRAHSLGDSLDIKLSSEPQEISQNLWAQEIDSAYELEKNWGQVQKYLTSVLSVRNLNSITTEELAFFPGMEDLLSLLRILDHYKQNDFDVIIVDCAPTGETLALLSFPEMLGWWMNRLFPIQKKAVKLLRPVAEPVLGVTLPSDSTMNEIETIYYKLAELRELFSNQESTSIRIVINPEKMVIKEAQRSFTYLNIYEFNVDAVFINRVLPCDITDSYFSAWKENQQKYLKLIAESFSPLPLYHIPLFDKEIGGLEMLEKVGEAIFAEDDDPAAIKYHIRTQTISKDESGYTLSLYLPFTVKEELSLSQKDDELIVKAGSFKRNITLPRTLQNLSVQGANFEQDTLNIRFKNARSS